MYKYMYIYVLRAPALRRIAHTVPVSGFGFRVSGFGLGANMAHTRQSRPDSGHGFQVKVLELFQVVHSSLGIGTWRRRMSNFLFMTLQPTVE